MTKFKVGDIVTVIAMNWVGTVVYLDQKQGKYLVRVNGTQQMYYTENELEMFKK